MKKVIMIIMSVIIFSCISNTVFASKYSVSEYMQDYAKECTEDEFENNRYGCKDRYEVQGGGKTYTNYCTESDYKTGYLECKDSYIPNECIDEWGTYGCQNMKQSSNGTILCTDSDYANKANGCNNIKMYSMSSRSEYWANKMVPCTDDDYKSGNNGCKRQYSVQGGGNTYTYDCTADYYKNGAYGCKDSYIPNECTDDDYENKRYGCNNELRNNRGETCNDWDYEHKNGGCNNIRQYSEQDQEHVQDPGYSAGGVDFQLKEFVQKIWGTAVLIVQILSVGCVVFAGLRYMYASADQKADIKQGLIYLTIGAIFIFSAVTIIHLVVKITGELL